MKLKTIMLFPILMFLSLTVSGDDSPDMKAGFVAEMPGGWELESFKITASEDVGTKVSPVSQHRFVAEVSPSEDLFERVATLHGKDVLKKVFEKGSDAEVHGIGVAVFSAGKWETHYQIEKSPFYEGGKSANSFGTNQVVIGTSDYRALVASAKGDMAKLQGETDKLSAEFQKKMTELQAESAQAQAQINQNSELVSRLQQETNKQQQEDYKIYSQKTQEISKKYAAEFNTKRTSLIAAFNDEKKAIDTQYAADIKLVRAERTEAAKWRQTERRRVQTEYNATIKDARAKKLDASSLAAVKEGATIKARDDYDAIDAQAKAKTDDTRAREAKLTEEYRAKVGALQSDNQAAMKTMSEEFTSTRDAELGTEKKKYDEIVAASTAKLTEARNAHNAMAQRLNERRRQMNSELSAMRANLDNNNRNIQAVSEVLAFLESSAK